MTTFKQYLQESALIDMNTVAEELVASCPQFVKEWASHKWDAVVVRGVPKDNVPDMYTVENTVLHCPEEPINIRKDRKPSDTNPLLHSILDDWFNDKFGIRGRSQSAFAYSYATIEENPDRSNIYGKLAIVIPTGAYKMLWSDDIGDLYTDLPNVIKFDIDGEYDNEDLDLSDVKPADVNAIRHSLDRSGYKVGTIPGKTEGEIMVIANSYYPIFGKVGAPIMSQAFKRDFETLMNLATGLL